MAPIVRVEHEGATKADDNFVTPESTKSVANDENWFFGACRQLYDGKPGTALHFSTGFDERSCQRYAAGTVKPPAYFLRALLRSEQGWTWLNATMDGSKAQWWRDLNGARKLAEQFKIEVRE